MDSDYLFDDAKREIPKITNKFSLALRITLHNLRFERLWASMRPDRKGRGEAGEGIHLLVQPIHKSNVAVAAPEKCATDNDNVIEWRILVRGRIHKRIFSSQRQKRNL